MSESNLAAAQKQEELKEVFGFITRREKDSERLRIEDITHKQLQMNGFMIFF